MAQSIPLQAVPNQVLAVPISGQSCILTLNQRVNGLYIDVFINGAPVVLGVICENQNPIVRNSYLGFPGDLVFLDTEGSSDPDYTGLAGRFQLMQINAAELVDVV